MRKDDDLRGKSEYDFVDSEREQIRRAFVEMVVEIAGRSDRHGIFVSLAQGIMEHINTGHLVVQGISRRDKVFVDNKDVLFVFHTNTTDCCGNGAVIGVGPKFLEERVRRPFSIEADALEAAIYASLVVGNMPHINTLWGPSTYGEAREAITHQLIEAPKESFLTAEQLKRVTEHKEICPWYKDNEE